MGLVVSAASSICSLGRSRSQPSPPPPAPVSQDGTPQSKGPDSELVRIFRHYDADGDGGISAAEMREMCDCTAAEAEEMVSAADTDGDGFVSLEELGALLDGGESDALRKAFAEYDEDGDGVITAEELRRALRRLRLGGEELTAERCAEMVEAVDCDGDGVISFDEFKAMMATKSA